MGALGGTKHAVLSRNFLLFLLTGGFAAAVNWGSRILFNLWMPFSAAIVLAYICGMITAYVLAKLFVFKTGTQSAAKSILFFTLVNLVAVAQTWIVSMGLVYFVFPKIGIRVHVKELAHLVGVMVPVFTSYVGHKRWSFKAD